MPSATAGVRLLAFISGIFLQCEGFRTSRGMGPIHLIHRNMPSWLDAYQQPPNTSYELISPFLAEMIPTQLQNLTGHNGAIFVNGFAVGEVNKGYVFRFANKTNRFEVYCRNKSGSSSKDLEDPVTYQIGRRHCSNIIQPLFLDQTTGNLIGNSFKSTTFWAESPNETWVQDLFKGNETIKCMVLDLTEGKLMLDDCKRSHSAVYVIGDYAPTIQKFTDQQTFPPYKPHDQGTTVDFQGGDISTASDSSTENNQPYSPGQNGTDRTKFPGTTETTDSNKSSEGKILNMNIDIFITLIGVAFIVIVVFFIVVCCWVRRRKVSGRHRPALSEDYSNPVDSIGMKEEDQNANPNNGVYASPQDSIAPVQAKKRDSIGEGVYDVTFTSSKRHKNTIDPDNEQQTNAYAHVTIQPKGGAINTMDDSENQYDSTSFSTPKHAVLVSPSHSDHEYGEVQIKTVT